MYFIIKTYYPNIIFIFHNTIVFKGLMLLDAMFLELNILVLGKNIVSDKMFFFEKTITERIIAHNYNLTWQKAMSNKHPWNEM